MCPSDVVVIAPNAIVNNLKIMALRFRVSNDQNAATSTLPCSSGLGSHVIQRTTIKCTGIAKCNQINNQVVTPPFFLDSSDRRRLFRFFSFRSSATHCRKSISVLLLLCLPGSHPVVGVSCIPQQNARKSSALSKTSL